MARRMDRMNNPPNGRLRAGVMSARRAFVVGEAGWPTPRKSEWKGVGPLGSKSHKYRLAKGYLDATVQEVEGRTGRVGAGVDGGPHGLAHRMDGMISVKIVVLELVPPEADGPRVCMTRRRRLWMWCA